MTELNGTAPAVRTIFYRPWFLWLLSAGIVCEIFFLYEDTLLWMKTAWVDYVPDRAGVWVPPLFGWMAYNRLKRRPKMVEGSLFPGYAVIFLSLLVFMTGRMVDIYFLQALSMIGVGFALVVIIGGIRLGGMFLFPFFFLVLMIPSVSYLLESFAGALLRQAVLHGSAFVLKLMDGAWEITPAGLVHHDQYLQVRFFRDGVSSVLLLLIWTFAAAEISVKRETGKFCAIALFVFFFIGAYSLHYVLSGWAISSDVQWLRSVMALHEGWIPAAMFLFLMTAARLFARHFAKKPVPAKKGARTRWLRNVN